MSLLQKILIRLPFSIYFGWITVATVANVVTFLVSVSWDRFGIAEYLWADIIILVAALIGAAAIIFYKDIAYGLVIIWAYIGIALKHLSPEGFDGEYLSVIITVFVSIILLIAAQVLLVQIFLKEKNANKVAKAPKAVKASKAVKPPEAVKAPKE
jgi:hypothetical protein